MKRILAVLLAAALVLCLAGCGGAPKQETEPVTTKAPETEPVTTKAPETEPQTTKAPETEPATTKAPETEPETEPASDAPSEGEKEAYQDAEIAGSDWLMIDGKLHYTVGVKNPNKDYGCRYPQFRITAKNAKGEVLATKTQTLSVIYPEKTFVFGGNAFDLAETPADVVFEMVPGSSRMQPASSLPAYQPMEAKNITAGGGKTYGEIYNPNDYELDAVIVIILFNDKDEIVGIESTYTNKIGPGETKSYSRSYSETEPAATFRVYVNQW